MIKQYNSISKTLAVVISSIGIIVFIGWLLDISILKSIVPNALTMKANTALCFILGGFSLWHINEEKQNGLKKMCSITFPSIMILMALLTLGESLFEINLGIDEFLFNDETGALATSAPGRMAPLTAFCFILSGTSLILLYRNKAFRIFQLLSLTVFALALLTLIGYAYAVEDFQGGMTSFTKMAIHTSLAFVFLSAGMLFSKSDNGIMRIYTNNGVAGITIRKLLPVIIFIPLISGWLRLIGQDAGYYDTEFGEALFSFITILILVIVVFGISSNLLSIDKKRKKAEELLNEYKHFFNNSNDLACIANMQGYFEIINPKFKKVLGYSEKEFLERQLIEFIHPDDIDSSLQEHEKQKSDSKVVTNLVNRYQKKDGNYLWLDWNSTPDPATGKIYAIARDITERKKAEEILKKSLKEISDYKYALDESSIVGITNQKGIIQFANDNFCKISGYTIDELIGQDHRIINSGHHPKKFIKKLWKTIANGKIWRGELKNRAKDGTIYWVDTTIVPFLNEQGKPFQYLAIRTDITERKKAEQELKNIAAKLKEAQALAKVGNWESNLATNTDTWSDEAFKILGIDPNTTIPSLDTYLSCIHPNDLPFVKEKVNEVFATLKGNTYNYRIKRKDGTIIHAVSQSTMDFDENNEPVRLFGIVQDITEIKNAEEKLIEINKELESFSYSISHDLRAPLRAINGYAQILHDDYGKKLDPEGIRILETIKHNAIKMGTLIDDLLAFSRLGRKEIQKTVVNMNKLTESVIHEMNKSMTHKAEINTTHLHNVKADYSLLHQVMSNLVSNAVKYSSKEKNPVVKISSEEKNGEIVFSVNDNGAGFDMEYADKLFGVFQRLHSQEEFEGTGVGLAIVQRIITRHGGKVWAEGKVNEGAVFNFSLTKN
jgi:PAS domain S-box-containing protein